MKLLRFSSITALLLLACGCSSFSPPKMPAFSLPDVPVPSLKMPKLPAFTKRDAASTALPIAADGSEPTSRGFSLMPKQNPLKSGPGFNALLGTAPNAKKAEASLAKGLQLYEQAQNARGEQRVEQFQKATPPFARAAERAATPAVKEKARFLAGESAFFGEEYPGSVEHFGKLTKEFPNTRYMDTVDQRRFSMAQYWVGVEQQDSKYDLLPNMTNDRRPVVDTFGNAVKLFDRIRFDNPNGEMADHATMAAAVSYFERGKFGKANDLFDDLRMNFPSSDHQFKAHLLSLKTKLKMYQGPEYDGMVLDEAEDICRRVVTAFPEQAQAEREYLENALKEVRLLKAQREYTVAEYYDRRKEYGAAEVYYNNVRDEFQDTNLAVESKERLAQIESLPKRPTQSMEWLADAFPKETDPKPLLSRAPSAKETR